MCTRTTGAAAARAATQAGLHPLAYDDAALGDGTVPRDEAALVKVPTVVIDGEASPPALRDAATALAAAIPAATRATLAGQTHDVAPDVLAPELIKFFLAS